MDQAPDEPSGEEPLEEFYGEDEGDGDVFAFRPAEARLPPPPPRKARTATGAILTGIALGLQQVFDPEKKKDPVAIEQEAPGEPDEPQRYEVRLNGSPRDARAVYRPWVDKPESPPGR